MDNYDVIIGLIADDKMKEAIRRFSKNGLTDEGLIACLSRINYGYQYVLKTEFACSKCEILKSRPLIGYELNEAKKYSSLKREESYNIVNEISYSYAGVGNYFTDVIYNLEKEENDYEYER